MQRLAIPYIPTSITVHLGSPDSNARNVTVPFIDYIKNVASSEIYPTWNRQALIANILAQTSFALNRVYTEYYRSRGKNFDITDSTAIDQKYIYGRNIFSDIDQIVNNIFDEYIRRIGYIEPLAAKFCNGTTVTCDGLSQWGSENLAQQGLNYLDILYRYYGYNIEIVTNAPTRNIVPSYPGYPISRGMTGANVQKIQVSLNRISLDYPAIPKVYPVDGIYGEGTERAVRTFQSIFNLTQDGIVGKSTWYKMVYLYVGILSLSELDSEGQRLFGYDLQYPDAISFGDSGEKVLILQYFLAIIASYNPENPPVAVSGTFGEETLNAVKSFQLNNNMTETGVVDDKTWDAIYNNFNGIIISEFANTNRINIQTVPFTRELQSGSSGREVSELQRMLNYIWVVDKTGVPVPVTGTYDAATTKAVTDFQRDTDLPATGVTNRATWDRITESYTNAVSTTLTHPVQYPGTELKRGMRDTPIGVKEVS